MLKQPHHKYAAFKPFAFPQRTWPNRVLDQAPRWCSVDLRDGNQALIEPMDAARKLRMFEMLVRIGFKEIEIGFPSASQTDFDFVRHLIEENLIPDDVVVQVLTPAREELIRRTFESLAGARRAVVHMYNATAPMMRDVVLGLDQDGVVELATKHARLIKQLADAQPQTEWSFEYSPETFSDTELPFSKRVVDSVTQAFEASREHPCIINLPTTVERCTPNVFADMIEWMHNNLARRDGIVLSVHPHNDRGTGTAAAEMALLAGADRVEGCLFGNGERTGNLDIVNVALNLYTQGVSPNLDFSDIDEVRRCVEHCNQLPVHPRHPYGGDLVYTSFSGSHQDAIKKAFAKRQPGDIWDMPYLPLDPKDVGRSYDAVVRVNSQSGKGGISYLLETEYGVELPRRLQIEFSKVVQSVMDNQGTEQTAAALWQIFVAEYGLDQTDAALGQHTLVDVPGQQGVQLSAQARIGARNVTLSGQGTGPIDAFVNALNAQLGSKVRVLDYHEHSIGAGAAARAAAYLELRIGDELTVFGVGVDSNIVSASLKAIMSGLQRAERQGAVKWSTASVA
jgi:2-isopropylmalate synthase